jgi:hypothetical protein
MRGPTSDSWLGAEPITTHLNAAMGEAQFGDIGALRIESAQAGSAETIADRLVRLSASDWEIG